MPNEITELRDQAERFRGLARTVADERNQRLLLEMAQQLDGQADAREVEAARRNEG